MKITVFERQVITYAWEIEVADTIAAAEAAEAIDGVPDTARTVRFASENWWQPVPAEDGAES